MKDINKLVIDNLNGGDYKSTRFITKVDDRIFATWKMSDIIEFIKFSLDYLEITNDDPQVLIELTFKKKAKLKSFAYYIPTKHIIYVNCKERHNLDIMRSLAHELVHYKQDVRGELNDSEQMGSDNDGVPIENEANSIAGIIMRKYGKKRPDFF